MIKILLLHISLLLFCMNFTLPAQNSGEEIFKNVCSACHTIGMGRKVGPDLSGVYNLRKNEWLIPFIQSSQKFIKSGDTAAIAIYNEYNRIPMPDNQLNNEQILSIIEYIRNSDIKPPVAEVKPAVAEVKPAVPGDTLVAQENTETIIPGNALFYGYSRFANGGSPCFSCHHLQDQSILGGGKLALDLTGSYSKLGAVGIKAILTNPPFPAMKTAMIRHDLTENEIQALTSLLKSTGDQKYTRDIPSESGLFFFIIAFVSALILTVHLYVFYDNRKIT
jgi:hypothetical protein